MKKIFVFLLSVIALAGCNNQCTIVGTVSNSNLNGKKIFLMPLDLSDSLGVDSVVIENNKFQFECHDEMLANIMVDYHYRLGNENLLVITEPGNINVKIGPVSSGGGTPQNDSLQVWKALIINQNSTLKTYQKEYDDFIKKGDTLSAKIMKNEIEKISTQFYSRTKQMTQNLKSGTLYDFLIQQIPNDN
ncbi:MAG: DUF4369 domain-containing protein [Bacteroidales bacterium]|nr:DUF4369 domain-containing protein [Bacteroidales bacterium]